MEANTPKRQAIEKFIEHENGSPGVWMIRVHDEQNAPKVMLEALRDDVRSSQPEKTLELPTDQVLLYDDELDEATKTKIRAWMASL